MVEPLILQFNMFSVLLVGVGKFRKLIVQCHVRQYLSRITSKPIWGFRPGPTRTGLYSHRRWLEAASLKLESRGIPLSIVAKAKTLISCAVMAQLICVFVFAYAKRQFSHDASHLA